jgi:hypothetical protein
LGVKNNYGIPQGPTVQLFFFFFTPFTSALFLLGFSLEISRQYSWNYPVHSRGAEDPVDTSKYKEAFSMQMAMAGLKIHH